MQPTITDLMAFVETVKTFDNRHHPLWKEFVSRMTEALEPQYPSSGPDSDDSESDDDSYADVSEDGDSYADVSDWFVWRIGKMRIKANVLFYFMHVLTFDKKIKPQWDAVAKKHVYALHSIR